ncbi:MAG: bifunctional diguanylate cyclase/phosphodiesterase [Pseudomonadota bacterium]
MRKPLKINLLNGLVVAIVLLGLISVVTVIMNARTYRELAFNFQRQYMTQLIAAEANTLLADNAEQMRRMGLSIQSDADFRAAFDARADSTLAAVLEAQYYRAPVTSNLVNAVGIYVYDADFNLLAVAMRSDSSLSDDAIICPDLITKARIREGARRLKPLHELCLQDDIPYQAAIAPVGGLVPRGYLQVVADPLPALEQLDAHLKMPVRISRIDGTVQYAASGWSEDVSANFVQSAYTLTTDNSRPALEIVAARNADALVLQIERTNRGLLITVVLVLLTTVLLALLLVNYSVFRPLHNLRQRVREEWARSVDGEHAAAVPGMTGPTTFHALGELYETLHDLAIRDPLTGTYNRALLEDRLMQVIAEHRRNPGVAAVLLIDMVRFKYVNDMLGHHIGDILLKDVVGRIADVLRESDTLARLGGDEFVIVLPGTDADQAVQVAHKIIKSMKHHFEVREHKIFAAVTIGIALTPQHGTDVDTLLRNADYAMYTAKALKQGCAVYDPSTTEDVDVARMTLDGVLNHDISRNDLFLVYQPVIEFATGRISYLEALLRWRKPDGNILLPDTFIRVAEQSGLIRQLSEWVIETACRELALLREDNHDLRTGINLSMHNLHDFNLITRIRDALQRHHVAPDALLLEITETGVMLDPEQVIETLRQLAALGLRLSIDDFGTGHSSLVYLKRLPVHTLKVDKSFVAEMDSDEENASIVRATIDLAHNLGLTVTAEGVETRAVYERLQGMGCDYYQGYYTGRPMTLKEVLQWLESRHRAW